MTNPIKSPDEPAVRNGRAGQTEGVVFSASETTDVGHETCATVSLDCITPADSPGEIHWLQIDSPPPRVGGADEAAHFDQLPVSGNDKSMSETVKTHVRMIDHPLLTTSCQHSR